jgi:hypothetical protein
MEEQVAKAKQQADEEAVALTPRGPATIGDRIAAFQMLDQMKGATQAQKTVRLSLVGFTNAEIAAMLDTTSAVVSQNLYSERKKPRKRPDSE